MSGRESTCSDVWLIAEGDAGSINVEGKSHLMEALLYLSLVTACISFTISQTKMFLPVRDRIKKQGSFLGELGLPLGCPCRCLAKRLPTCAPMLADGKGEQMRKFPTFA
jgi:hypothetical protein